MNRRGKEKKSIGKRWKEVKRHLKIISKQKHAGNFFTNKEQKSRLDSELIIITILGKFCFVWFKIYCNTHDFNFFFA